MAVNGDVFTDLDLTAVWDRHHEVGAEGTIALTPVDDPSRYGVVPTDDAGRVLGFVEKPPRHQAPTNWINAGSYVLEPSVLERIESGRKVSIERETFPAMAADGGLWAVHSDAYWVDAGTPSTYLQVQLDLLDGVRGAAHDGVAPTASVASGARVDRSVGDNARESSRWWATATKSGDVSNSCRDASGIETGFIQSASRSSQNRSER